MGLEIDPYQIRSPAHILTGERRACVNVSLAMDLFFRSDTSGVTRVSDTYVCMMPYEQKYEQKLQQQAVCLSWSHSRSQR